MSNKIIYEIKIERKYRESKIERALMGDLWWDVDTTVNGKWNYELCSNGWAKSLDKAKKKALEHVMKAEKKVGRIGDEFGVVVSVVGDADAIKEALK